NESLPSGPEQLWRFSYPDGRLSRLTNDLNDYTGVSLTAARDALVTTRSDPRVAIWVGDAAAAQGSDVVQNEAAKGGNLAWARDQLLYDTTADGQGAIRGLKAGAS